MSWFKKKEKEEPKPIQNKSINSAVELLTKFNFMVNQIKELNEQITIERQRNEVLTSQNVKLQNKLNEFYENLDKLRR